MKGKIHFGIMEECGSYESPELSCDHIICGCTSFTAYENATDNERQVTCKKCLKKLSVE